MGKITNQNLAPVIITNDINMETLWTFDFINGN